MTHIWWRFYRWPKGAELRGTGQFNWRGKINFWRDDDGSCFSLVFGSIYFAGRPR